MAKVTQAAKVGAFVVAAGAASFFLYRGVDKQLGSGNGYKVYAILDDAAGLANHSRVTIAGIPIGTIEGIALDKGRARVQLRIKQDVVLYQNATVGKKSASLLGESLLVLTPGTNEPALKDGDEIKTLPPDPSVDDIKRDVAEIASLVKDVARQLATSVGTDEGGKNMRSILKNLADATEALNATIRENRELVHDTLQSVNSIAKGGEPQVAKILENVRVITEDVKTLVSTTEKGGSGSELKETVASISRASRSLESALSRIDTVAGRLERGEGSLGKLTKDEALVNEVQGAAEGVNDFVGGISRLQTIVGLRSDYNFLANTIKSYVELRLQPREDKYYVIELINDPRGKTSFAQTDVSTTNPRDPANYRVITTTTTDAFRFSLQFARRLGPFTGRFGIKESTGGLGLDVHLLRDRFELRSDFFGFGEEIQPRFRVYIGYEFIHRLWLLGGVDHLFLANRRDYFLGLQLRFNDDDLKSVLPVGGGAAAGAR